MEPAARPGHRGVAGDAAADVPQPRPRAVAVPDPAGRGLALPGAGRPHLPRSHRAGRRHAAVLDLAPAASPAGSPCSGRTYVAVSLPAAVAAAAVAVLSMQGPNQQVGTVLAAVLWFGTTLAGCRAASRKDFKRHREWMVRSFALVFAIVVNRLCWWAAMRCSNPARSPAARSTWTRWRRRSASACG
ncbi:MAG: DUF2306 domain-containing protein [Thermocrispum sp.]